MGSADNALTALILVRSGGQRWALPRAAVQRIARREQAMPVPALVTLLGLATADEPLALWLAMDDHSRAVSISEVALIAAPTLPLPGLLTGRVHPAVAAVVVYDDMVLPLLDAAWIVAHRT